MLNRCEEQNKSGIIKEKNPTKLRGIGNTH